MMRFDSLRIIEDKDEILSCQRKLFDILSKRADSEIVGKVFAGKPIEGTLYWISALGMWYMYRFVERSRHWNGFGIGEPDRSKSNTIVCEINFPPKGIDRRIGAAFARDPLGNYYVVHRGKLGGNYSKKFFEDMYSGEWTTVADGNRESSVVVIGPLDETLPENIRDFVYEVKRIKTDFNLKEKFQKILNEYKNARKGVFTGHPLAKLLRTDLPDELKKIVPESDYLIKGSAGQGNWAIIPWVAIMDPNITDTTQKGFYIVYLFKEDMEGVYLSLHQGVTEIASTYKDPEKVLKERAVALRTHVKDLEYLNEISLGKTRYAPLYEAGNIIAKYYPSNKLPNDDELVSDLQEFLDIYKKLEPIYKKIIEDKGEGIDFYTYLKLRGYHFKPELIENFLLSLKVKPFVILTGNSGTGKTKIAQLYGQYISTPERKRYLIVPVGANWTEKRHIFGYLNIMTGKYQSTPALDFIRKASKDPENPYILILDEMNLSHVERYFSDFLSALESGEPVPLHDDPDCDFHSEITLPENLLVVGTVNVDETTYMFSPKVLDRANTIEFETLNPREYLLEEGEPGEPAGDLEFLEDPLNHDASDPGDLGGIRDELVRELSFFHEKLQRAGFDFGFRVTMEVLEFMRAAWVYEGKPAKWENWERYLDAQIKQKILPKIHGPERLLKDTLNELKDHCEGRFPDSHDKLGEMVETLRIQRYVSFIR
ncbi:DUF3578 domain-containing protein [Methanothermobacter sp. THM-2]|nr:DUF3578 domain-containing protein [Methanothermobacter sp. THM-2]